MKPQNFEEHIVWYSLISTYILYIAGLLYIANSTIAWVLFIYLCKKLWIQTQGISFEEKISIPWIVWLWIICMLIMAIGTYIGLVNFDYDIKDIIRGLLNWTRDWALLALFPLAGCCLNIRPHLIYRATCLLCLQSLFFIPISYAAYLLHLPSLVYSSPLERITQNGTIYYNVVLYFKEFDAGESFRLTLFAPWSPALALLGLIYFFFALQEENKIWRWIGLVSSILITYLTASRTAIISLPIIIVSIWFLSNFSRPYVHILSSIICFSSGIFSSFLVELTRQLQETFTTSRQGSSRVRDILARMALDRFKDAPVWGHGRSQPGFEATANMPIGSHHTWIGLLYVKGLIGFFAFLIPMVYSFIYLLLKAQKNTTSKVGLTFLLALISFTFTDNQEVLAYLYWPGLIIMGISFKEEKNAVIFK
ncbi:O-Antigen ligase [Cylindrospermum stagnale PCC 7417]|uniref:O-Antigen ligase n=1 Tax=Cylindrospermum stagnale PCC 7417 TaxID=56107 RepID=K9WR89_9NOST|nr:O-antigen ligase family protein [Cylindrospermum stagnale]AFZ22703.1 O-Antigen ligase [Cylindrospermum stagnale PCC 7417]